MFCPRLRVWIRLLYSLTEEGSFLNRSSCGVRAKNKNTELCLSPPPPASLCPTVVMIASVMVVLKVFGMEGTGESADPGTGQGHWKLMCYG